MDTGQRHGCREPGEGLAGVRPARPPGPRRGPATPDGPRTAREPEQTFFEPVRIEALGPSLELYSTFNGGGPPSGYFLGFNSYFFSICQRAQPECDLEIRRADDALNRYAFLRSPLQVGPSRPVGTGFGMPTFTVAGGPETRLLVQAQSGATAGRNLVRLINRGPATFRFDNTSSGVSWGFGSVALGDRFFIAQAGLPGLSLTLDGAGNLTLAGLLTQMSDRGSKKDIAPVDPRALLDRLAALPVATWTYKTDTTGARHIGPMAQDFSAAFGLGADPTHLAPSDVAGVTLAAVQALQQELLERDAQIAALAARLSTLEQAGRSAP